MRFREFFIESVINLSVFRDRNSHYWRNILRMIKNGEDFKLNDRTFVKADPNSYNELYKIWDGESRTASPEQILLIKKHGFRTTTGKVIPWSKIYKSKEIKYNETGSDDEEQKPFWNLGNVVEAIMGAAVTAKFIEPDKTITTKDIIRVLRGSKQQSTFLNNVVKQSYSGTVRNDNVKFSLSLNQIDTQAVSMSFENPEDLSAYKKANEIHKAYENAAEYVNTSKTVQDALDRVIRDTNPNTIIIESEGAAAANQKGTKADLFITIDGKRERLLSLKAGKIPQVGQVSGASFKNIESFFKSVVGFGLPASMNNETDFPRDSRDKEVKKYVLQNGFTKAYKHIYSSLRSTLSGDSNYKEYNFTSQVFKGLKHHATLDEEIIIVYVSPAANKAYLELSFGKELREALDHYDLVPRLSNTTLKIVGIPKDELGKEMSGGKTLVLFQMRSSVQGNAIRNAVEIGNLTKALADLEKIRVRRGEKPAEPKTLPPTDPTTIKQPEPKQQVPTKPISPPQQKTVAPTSQNVDLSKSPLTAKWMAGR